MCDANHFENDRRDFEKRGLVTRQAVRHIAGSGVSMMLPVVANAASMTESDVIIDTPDGSADGYFVPVSGTARGSHLAGHLRAPAGLPPDGQAPRRVGLRRPGRQSVLPLPKGAHRGEGTATPIEELRPLAQKLDEATRMTDAKAFVAWLDLGRKDRRIGAGLLHAGGPWPFARRPRCRREWERSPRSTPGRLVTDGPNSPHLQAAKSKAQFLVFSRPTTTRARRATRLR